ncbi:MAG: hypothetical protein JRJ69_15710 [Deltaproteobacteria bacterium]|nr:hypothetical protein [Deltaproteobacteria bacterium]
MSTVWLVIEEDLSDRSEARDAVAQVKVFAKEEDAKDYAFGAAMQKGYVWDGEEGLWWDSDESTGTVRDCASEVNK